MSDENDSKTVWLWNIPYNLTEEEVIKTFGVCGKIEKIDLPHGKNHYKKPYAFIHYADEKSAEQAIKDLDQIVLGGRTIGVRFRSKAKNLSARESNQRDPSPGERGDYSRSGRRDYPSPSPPMSRKMRRGDPIYDRRDDDRYLDRDDRPPMRSRDPDYYPRSPRRSMYDPYDDYPRRSRDRDMRDHDRDSYHDYRSYSPRDRDPYDRPPPPRRSGSQHDDYYSDRHFYADPPRDRESGRMRDRGYDEREPYDSRSGQYDDNYSRYDDYPRRSMGSSQDPRMYDKWDRSPDRRRPPPRSEADGYDDRNYSRRPIQDDHPDAQPPRSAEAGGDKSGNQDNRPKSPEKSKYSP